MVTEEMCFQIGRGQFDVKVVTTKAVEKFENENLTVIKLGNASYKLKPINLPEIFNICNESQKPIAEVLKDLIETLYGEYWVVICDHNSGKVYFFNDHMGFIPCYYGLIDNQFIISDSLKSFRNLVNEKLTISQQAIFNYMYFHCIPAPNTIYSEVNKLEPGVFVTINKQHSIDVEQLYRPEFNVSKDVTELKIKELQEQCLATIEESVNRNVSENCGAFLSGGLDSSTVAGMLAKNLPIAKTLSIGFHIDGYDETAYAKLTSEHFKTEHQTLYLQAEDAAQEFVKVAQYFDEPFGNSSAMATYFCAKLAKRNGIDTLLSGDGGDEIFAGNERYAKQKKFEIYAKIPKWSRILINFIFNNKVVKSIPIVSKFSNYVRQAEIGLPGRLQTYNFINMFGVESVFTQEFLSSVDATQPLKKLKLRYDQASSSETVDKMLYLDWKFILTDNDLVKVTKMCELADVKVKYPLLDKSLVDFSCKVPANVKLPGYKLRHFFKESCRGFLADETLNKSKHGFGLPFGLWLKENEQLKSIASDALENFKSRGIVKDSLIEDALKSHEKVHASYYGELIWIMVVLELWLQGVD